MSSVNEIAQYENELREAALRAVSAQEYGQLHSKYVDAHEQYVRGRMEAMLNHLIGIESLVSTGKVLEACQANYEMIRDSFEHLTPFRQNEFWNECRPKCRQS